MAINWHRLFMWIVPSMSLPLSASTYVWRAWLYVFVWVWEWVSDGFTSPDTFILWPNGNGIWHTHTHTRTRTRHTCLNRSDGLSLSHRIETEIYTLTAHNLTWQRNFWIRDEWKFSRKTIISNIRFLGESRERFANDDDDDDDNGKNGTEAKNCL